MSAESAIPSEFGVGRTEDQLAKAVIDRHLKILHVAGMHGPEDIVMAIAVRRECIGHHELTGAGRQVDRGL